VSRELHHFVGRALPDDDARYDAFVEHSSLGSATAGETPGVESSDSDASGIAFAIQPAAEDAEEMVRAEVVCFCDIPADDLGLHMTKYGPFGISFRKRFLCQQGANPVYYVARDARAALSWEADDDTLGRLFSAEIRRFLGRNPHFAGGDRDDAWRGAVALYRFARTYVFAFVKPFFVTLADGEPLPDDDPTNVQWNESGES
jgi:Putative abortive phage resistance protein AbiGi, antitoxin